MECAQPQYIFIHHALLEKIVLGDVVIPRSQFEMEYFQLCDPLTTTDVNELQLQYDVSVGLFISQT